MPSVDTPPFQITPDSEHPYIILQDFHASDPDITESVPAPSFPTQPASTTITDHAPTQPLLTSLPLSPFILRTLLSDVGLLTGGSEGVTCT